MPTAVVMPQMGESITEGTIIRWLKKVGDAVDRDEPLFEISTDKVDAEIPSPAAGVLTEISVKEGETVEVNRVVAVIGLAGEVAQATGAAPVDDIGTAVSAPQSVAPRRPSGRQPSTLDELRRRKSSPLVRRIAQEHGVDLGRISGSGLGGRVTRRDILEFLDRGPFTVVASPVVENPPAPLLAYHPADRVRLEPMSVMRRKIADHMVLSRRTSAHVHTVFHVNFSAVDAVRRQKKAEYEQAGAKITYLSFIAKAVVDALGRYPILNASIDGQTVVYKKDINLGIAVALEAGLIVPVVRNADECSLLGLSRAIAELAARAAAKQLKPDDVHGGTFTITNPGQLGAQFGLPIINQPQVAILGVGTIEQRPVVVDDAIAIQTMGYLTLGFDHRLVDGAVADQFMADVKRQIERFDPGQA